VIKLSSRALVHWRRPRREWLEPGGIYPFGTPPFDPFPTVSDIVSADFCPVAILHRLLHGEDRSPTFISERRDRLRGAGTLYHEFIAILKSRIVNGDLQRFSPDVIRPEFLRFVRGQEELQEIWPRYLVPWLNGVRSGEHTSVSPRERVFFEVTVASEYVPFRYEEQRLTYPLRGVIDEINLDRRLIIERTIVGGPDDDGPPEADALQLWLLWKVLNSIDRHNYPEELRGVNFDDFHIIVETPFHDFEIDRENQEFERRVHDAYAWIRDLTFDHRSEFEAYRNQRCDREPGIRCSFMHTVCRRRNFQFPQARSVMREEFRSWFRPLWHEIIWNSHLLQYRLLRLPLDDLEHQGWLARARITSFIDRDLIQVEIIRDEERGPILAHIQNSGRCELIFGTPSIGQRIEVTLESEAEGRLILRTSKRYLFLSNNTFILPDVALLESRPWYLTQRIQQDMFRFEHIGRENIVRARNDSLVQLIEAIFGSNLLRRERSNVG